MPSSTTLPPKKLDPPVNAPRFRKSLAVMPFVPAFPAVSTLSTLMTEFGRLPSVPAGSARVFARQPSVTVFFQGRPDVVETLDVCFVKAGLPISSL
jgi:hypothetical protein